MIGTTHFANAFIQAQSLAPVPRFAWDFRPAGASGRFAPGRPLRKAVMGYDAIIEGGFQFDGSPSRI